MRPYGIFGIQRRDVSVAHDREWEPIPVREAWPLEAHFTTWLAENLDQLSREIGVDLELIQEETWLPGNLRVDILARVTGTDQYVVIENQMEDSDNDHFAGLLHYASHSDSRILILVAGEITHWYRRTIDWLNDYDGMQIYGVEMSAWSKGDQVKRRLNIVSGPNHRSKWHRYEYPADKQKYLDFFGPLLAESWKQGIVDSHVARPVNDQEFPSGFDDVTYHVGFWGGPSASAYLWIDAHDSIYNKTIFNRLHEHQAEIEKMFGEPLLWDRRDGMRMSAVIATRRGSIDDSPETLDEIRDWMYGSLVKLKDAIHPKLEKIIAELQSGAPQSWR